MAATSACARSNGVALMGGMVVTVTVSCTLKSRSKLLISLSRHSDLL
jgi:hypothetical protein